MEAKTERVREHLARTLLTRRSALAALAQHPSWPEFVVELGEKRAKIEKRVLQRALNMEDPLSEREAGYLAGYMDGLSWLARVPTRAKNQLDRQLQREGGSE